MEFISLVLTIFWLLYSQPLKAQEPPQQMCHTALIRALENRCERFYNAERASAQSRTRRSETLLETSTSGATSATTQPISRRLPRNVVQECCKRACNMATLRKYCGSIRLNRLTTATESAVETESRMSTPAGEIQRSTTPLVINFRFETITETPNPEPIPIGAEFNEYHFY